MGEHLIDKKLAGQRLKQERERLALTQAEVAEKIRTTPINVSRWELGKTAPIPFFRRELCALFERKPSWLFPFLEDIQEATAYLDSADVIFRFNTPLADACEFYDRRGALIPLFRRLKLQSSVSVVGPRRIGKTWLLSYLQLVVREYLGANYHIGYVDASSACCTTLDRFTARMLEALGIAHPHLQTSDEHLIFLEKTLQTFKIKNETAVLCIDEFESILEKEGFHKTLLEHLRAMTDMKLCLVIASRDPLLQLIAQKIEAPQETSPFFNVFEQIRLTPFTRAEAETFALEKCKQAGFTEQEYGYLLLLGEEENQQWYPLRLQLAGSMMEVDKLLGSYDPDHPDYWQDFKLRLEEKYRSVMG